MKLVSHSEKCTGCRICELACSTAKENTINPRKARIHVVTAYPGILDNAVVCRQCEKPPCVGVCPVGALSIDEKTRAILVDESTCTGCERCEDACPYGAVTMHQYDRNKTATICDLCHGDPACVKWCPFAALELKT